MFVHLYRLRHLHVYRASANNDASSSPLSRARGRLSACSSLWLPVRRRLGTFCIARRPLILTVWAEIQRRFVDATSMSLRPFCALGFSAPTLPQLQSTRLGGRADGIIIVAAAACSCPFVAGTLHADARSVRRRCRVRPAPCRRSGARAAQLCLRSHRRFAS